MPSLVEAEMRAQSPQVTGKGVGQRSFLHRGLTSLTQLMPKGTHRKIEVGRIQAESGGNSEPIVGRRQRARVDVTIKLLPVDADGAAQIRNRMPGAAGKLQIIAEIRAGLVHNEQRKPA